MTEANPALVSTDVGCGDAAEMGANGRTHENLGVAAVRKIGRGRLLVETGGLGESMRLSDLGLGETADEDDFTVPRGLQHFTWGKLTDVELLVGVSHVASSRNHLVVDDGQDGLKTEHVT